MARTRASRPTLLALFLAAGLALAPLAHLDARPLAPRQSPTTQPRQAEEPRGILGFLLSWFSAVWGKDGSHIDPLG